jgi:LPXTG-motif cell wall-anchored protein
MIHPKEEKIIPILYYPLLGIILLLLFIVLTTLYMAVLDRLFAAFSWDPDSYTMFMGIAAVLLSIATMLLFRRRRQRS